MIFTWKSTVGLVALFGLAACSTTEVPSATVQPVVVQSKPLARPTLSLPRVEPFRARDVEWTVITPDNAEQIFEDLETSGQAVVLFGVTETGYENIALNTSQSLRVIMQQKAVIAGYEKYYIEANGIIYEYNRSIQQ
jgi:hypothetical protein